MGLGRCRGLVARKWLDGGHKAAVTGKPRRKHSGTNDGDVRVYVQFRNIPYTPHAVHQAPYRQPPPTAGPNFPRSHTKCENVNAFLLSRVSLTKMRIFDSLLLMIFTLSGQKKKNALAFFYFQLKELGKM